MLLTPGQTYSQLIKNYTHFQKAFAAAKDSYDKGRFFHSYQVLKKARSVKGFFQANEALSLHRELSKQLRRGGLEAIWERLNLIDTTSAKFCSENRVALSQGRLWTLLDYRGPRTEEIASGMMRAPILGVHRLATPDANFFFTLDRKGTMLRLDAETGREVARHQLAPASSVRFFRENVYLVDEEGLKLWDLSESKPGGSIPLPPAATRELFPLAEGRLVVNSPKGAEVYNLRQGKSEGVLQVRLPQEPAGGVTFVNESEDRRVLFSGYADGTFAISDPRSGKVFFSQNYETGPVTGVAINMQVAFGLVVSSTGKLVVFDLTNGQIIERTTAHPGAITHLQVTEDGRYLTTRTIDGSFRLWELSWALTDSTSPLSIDWLPSGLFNKLGSFFKPR